MRLKSVTGVVLTAAVVLSLSTGLTQAQTGKIAEDSASVSELSQAEQEQISQKLSEGFETLFSEVVYEQSPGNWSINREAAEREGVSPEEAESLAKFMEASISLPSQGEPGVSAQGLGTFAECVVWNFAPVPMSPQDAAAIGRLLKNKQWRAAADKIVQVAALNGATAALDYGISAIRWSCRVGGETCSLCGFLRP